MERSLRRAVLERLAAVEEMVVRTGSHLSVRTARNQLKSITGGWRELLVEHQPDLKGRCPVCSGWLRHRRWPCQVWVTAHEHLIGGTPVSMKPSAIKSNPFRRPRQVEVIPRQVEVIPRQVEASAAVDQNLVSQNLVDQPSADPDQSVADPDQSVADPDQSVADPDQSVADRTTQETTEDVGIHRAPVSERPSPMPRSRQG